MSNILRHLSALLLGLLLVACSGQPAAQAPQNHELPGSSVAATPLPVTQAAVSPDPSGNVPARPATEQPVQPTLVPTGSRTTPTSSSNAPSIPPTVSPTPSIVVGQVVLRVGSGSTPGSVGLTGQAGPSTFRVAADGSLRVMDTVNKRLLFYGQATQELTASSRG